MKIKHIAMDLEHNEGVGALLTVVWEGTEAEIRQKASVFIGTESVVRMVEPPTPISQPKVEEPPQVSVPTEAVQDAPKRRGRKPKVAVVDEAEAEDEDEPVVTKAAPIAPPLPAPTPAPVSQISEDVIAAERPSALVKALAAVGVKGKDEILAFFDKNQGSLNPKLLKRDDVRAQIAMTISLFNPS